MQRIVGVDPGTRNCGVALIHVWPYLKRWQLVSTCVRDLNGRSSGALMILNLKSAMDQCCISASPPTPPSNVSIVAEKQIRGKLRCITSALEMYCATQGYVYRTFDARTIKRAFDMKCAGHAANKRNAVKRALQLTGKMMSDHEADALLLALHWANSNGWITVTNQNHVTSHINLNADGTLFEQLHYGSDGAHSTIAQQSIHCQTDLRSAPTQP